MIFNSGDTKVMYVLVVGDFEPRRIRNDDKVVTQRAEQRTHEKRGIKCVGKALTRRSSIQELQGMRMTDDISTTRSSRY